jgi:hypothetical protein
MRRYLAERFCRDRWCLCLDIDELFDYPGSSKISVQQFVSYLERQDVNAVVTQMLDMYSERAFGTFRSRPGDDFATLYPLYEINHIEKTAYRFGENAGALSMHFGGVRKRIFGTNNGLTKVSLFRMDGKLKPFHRWHHALNARLADVTCVLLHYPFVSSFSDKVAEAVVSQRYGYFTSDEYAKYRTRLLAMPILTFRSEHSRRYTTMDELVDQDFLMVSPAYTSYVVEQTERDNGPSPVKAAS